jgi:zinc transport system substrate-binding protein
LLPQACRRLRLKGGPARLWRAVVRGAIALTVLSACSPSHDGSSAGGKVSVVANFYPVYEAARRVGGDRVEVANLTPAGAEPHDLELTPRQVDQILDATVVLYMGRGFQPAVERTVKERTGQVTVDLLGALAPQLRKLQGEGSIRGGTDPHVWLDPSLMADIVDEVRDALIPADPAGTRIYEQNAAAYRAEIEALDRRFRIGLRRCSRRVIVTSHAAFGYLAARYGLMQEPVAGLSPEAEPDPKRLAELADLVQREGVTTIFTEELVSPRVAETLAREAGVRTAVLNPLEGLTSDEIARGESYVGVMERNLATLRVALGCG